MICTFCSLKYLGAYDISVKVGLAVNFNCALVDAEYHNSKVTFHFGMSRHPGPSIQIATRFSL